MTYSTLEATALLVQILERGKTGSLTHADVETLTEVTRSMSPRGVASVISRWVGHDPTLNKLAPFRCAYCDDVGFIDVKALPDIIPEGWSLVSIGPVCGDCKDLFTEDATCVGCGKTEQYCVCAQFDPERK